MTFLFYKLQIQSQTSYSCTFNSSQKINTLGLFLMLIFVLDENFVRALTFIKVIYVKKQTTGLIKK